MQRDNGKTSPFSKCIMLTVKTRLPFGPHMITCSCISFKSVAASKYDLVAQVMHVARAVSTYAGSGDRIKRLTGTKHLKL